MRAQCHKNVTCDKSPQNKLHIQEGGRPDSKRDRPHEKTDPPQHCEVQGQCAGKIGDCHFHAVL